MAILILFTALLNRSTDDNPNHWRRLCNQECRLLPGALLLSTLPWTTNCRKRYFSCLSMWPKYSSFHFYTV